MSQPSPAVAARSFPPQGLAYFWFLNDSCRGAEVQRQMDQFAAAKAPVVVLHPRTGLLIPFLSQEWIDLCRELALGLNQRGIETWLYDENYCPSGSCEGWIVAEEPGMIARAIERFPAAEALPVGDLHIFPTGKLLWAGAVPAAGPAGGPAINLTHQVGMIRRNWEVAPWDSRWYYPTTPLYPCPRSLVYEPEFALRKPSLPPGYRLVAFVARPTGREAGWGSINDPLSPAATDEFLRRGYEPYAQTMGDLFGPDKPITAMFTDEPKYHGGLPYTPGMLEAFAQEFGYDLRPRLEDLFDQSEHPTAMLTRVQFRQWCGRRFQQCWLEKVANWCHGHNLRLVGHISPEDDLVQQANCITNLMPLHKSFDLAGLDVIIPAVGDRRHAILNVGMSVGVSAAQQNEQPGVMSETLGASGEEITGPQAAKILAWQITGGVNCIVIHGAFLSTMGLRRFDAGPDFGPGSPRWRSMQAIDQALRPLLATTGNARQVAPVALLWPIRSYMCRNLGWIHEDVGDRKCFNDLLLTLLENQIGVQLLDEDDLARAKLVDGELVVGRSRYQHVLLSDQLLLSQATLSKLGAVRKAGLGVHLLGRAPAWVQQEKQIVPLPAEGQPWQVVSEKDVAAWCRKTLPRLVALEQQEVHNLRASIWEKQGKTTLLLMNLGEEAYALSWSGQKVTLAGGEIIGLQRAAGSSGLWQVLQRYATASAPAVDAPPAALAMSNWQARWGQGEWQALPYPKAAYQLRPNWPAPKETLPMLLTGNVPVVDKPLTQALEYQVLVQVPAAAKKLQLVLEPTAVRGRITVIAGAGRFDVTLTDIDPARQVVDLSGHLPAGAQMLRFVVNEPMPLDGIKAPPIVLVE